MVLYILIYILVFYQSFHICWGVEIPGSLSIYLDLLVPLLHAQAGPPQVVQIQASTCSSLLHLLLRLPPSTSPPRPPVLLCLLTYQPSPWTWCLSARRGLCSSSLSTRVLKSPAGQTPHPSPSHFQAKRTGRPEREKKARVRWEIERSLCG